MYVHALFGCFGNPRTSANQPLESPPNALHVGSRHQGFVNAAPMRFAFDIPLSPLSSVYGSFKKERPGVGESDTDHRGRVRETPDYLLGDLHVFDTCFTLFTLRVGCDAAAPALAELALSLAPPEVLPVIRIS